MKTLLAAIVAASTLLVAAESRACNPVQAITSYQSAALVAPVVAPVYQPMVTQQLVQQVVAQPVYAQAVLAQPVVQQVVVRQRVKGCRQFRTPVRSLLFR